MPQDSRTQELQTSDNTGSGDDAELDRLGAEFREKHRRHLELIEKNQPLAGGPPPPPQVLEEIRSLMQAKQKLAEAIAELRATTVSGLRVKAAVLLAYSQYDLDGNLHWTNHDELMGWSIARDLLGDEAAKAT